MKTNGDLYDRGFYDSMDDQTSESASAVVPHVVKLLHPRTVVDVGCGTGAWAAEFTRHGVNAVGVEGPWVGPELAHISSDSMIYHDLTEPLTLEGTYDLAVCLEVGEHLPGDRADGLVADLCRLAPAVLWSAAIPGQGGTNHINEQWPDWWQERFAEQGFQLFDCVRPYFWEDDRVAFWYRQNMFVYTSVQIDGVREAAQDWPIRAVHPQWMDYHLNSTSSLRSLAHQLPRALAASLRRRLRRR